MENIVYNIDSKFRDINTYSDSGLFTYKFKEPLKNISYIRLSSIELPTLFYTFAKKYNNLSFKINTYENIQYEIIIEEGNYESSTLIIEIQNKLDIINQQTNNSFIIIWDSINYKITLSNIEAFSLIFDNDNKHRSLGDRLGFRKNNNSYLFTNQLKKNILSNELYYWLSETFLDVTKDEYLFLRINDYGIIYNDVRSNSLLAKIILYDSQFIFDNGANFITKSYNFKQPVNISKLEIELINTQGQTIEMNLINYSLTLEFGRIYDSKQYDSRNFNLNKN
jgi:hypothetical protein